MGKHNLGTVMYCGLHLVLKKRSHFYKCNCDGLLTVGNRFRSPSGREDIHINCGYPIVRKSNNRDC